MKDSTNLSLTFVIALCAIATSCTPGNTTTTGELEPVAATPTGDMAGSDVTTPSCHQVMRIQGARAAPRVIDAACLNFTRAAGVPHREVVGALEGTNIEIMPGRQPAPCEGAPACATLGGNSIEIHVVRRSWHRYLANVIYRVLLVRFEPDVPVEGHNERLRELALCQNTRSCGAFHPLCPELPDGGRIQCDSLFSP